MNKKLFMLTLFLAIMLVSMLFASEDNDAFNQTRALSTKSPKSLLVDHKPIQFQFDSRGTLLFDQQSPTQGAALACQADSSFSFYPRFCDNFSIAFDATVDSIVFWGVYWNPGFPGVVLGFNIEIYPDSGGGNGPKQDHIYQAKDVVLTETQISGDWCIYEGSIPGFAATAGEIYWLVTQMILVYPPQWGPNCSTPPDWGDGQEGYFKSVYFSVPLWTSATVMWGTPYETGFQLYGDAAAATFWDFEDGWQGWTHTNGLAFPQGWDVQISGLHSSYTPPAAGDSSMWIDSDDAGSGVHVADTALSPVVVPPVGMVWLKWGLGFRRISSEEIYEVGLKYFDGTSWTTVPLVNYTATTSPMWDSVDVTAYASYDSVQVYFFYDDYDHYAWYTSFDNVGFVVPAAHDVGCIAVTSPVGSVPAGNYDVIGQIHNFGGSAETFDATAQVWDTTGGAWTEIFNQTATFTAFAVGGDSLHNFGTVSLGTDSYYYTQIYTALVGDEDSGNDTSFAYSWTAMTLGDIIFEMELSAVTGYPGQYGIEFDGTYFYLSSAYHATLPNAISVVDTLGNLVHSIPNGTSSTYGMRDLAWDGVYAGLDRIDTLYASDEGGEYSFGINLTTGTMDVYTPYTAPSGVTVCRALGWDDDDGWLFTANWDPLYKFTKDGTVIQGPVTGPGSVYGCAYDTDDVEGHYVWWHGQTGPYSAHLTQMNPSDMTMTGVTLDIAHTVSGGMAGGLCFYEGFRGMDVLFAIIQSSYIYGIFIRADVGVEVEPVVSRPAFMLEACKPNPVASGKTTIAYSTTKTGPVSLKIYDSAGRLVKTLVDSNEDAGVKNAYWDCTDNNHQPVSAGVYFCKLNADDKTATNKMVVVK